MSMSDLAMSITTKAPLLEARNITKHFALHGRLRARGRVAHAVDNVSLALYAGRITALVGESGSGKSTLARLLAQLHKITSGEIRLDGKPVKLRGGRAFRDYVAKVQLILQDPYGSFNPVLTIRRHLERAVRIHHPRLNSAGRRELIHDLLRQVNLDPPEQFADKFPHELSGGQLQRCSIARALAASPSVFLADEPVSSLDVSIRLGILNLLRRLTEERNVGLLYVTHDIASARYFAEDMAVMYAGELIESGPSEEVTQHAAHPYTQLLIASAPDPGRPADAERVRDIGQPPSLIDPPTGCRFHPRCPRAMARCSTTEPPRFDVGAGHWARCWLYAADQDAADMNRTSRSPAVRQAVAVPGAQEQRGGDAPNAA